MKEIETAYTFADRVRGREIIVILEGKAYQLESNDGRVIQKTEVDSLASAQEETDSRIILYTMYGRDNGYDYVRIKSPDTDILFILLH